MSDIKSVPSYLESAKPNPASNRAPWYKNTAPTYAGIFLWFVFWAYSLASGTPGGMLSAGVGVALGSVLVAALLCHFAFYYLPARFGQKTGLPLYIVGSSTFGATGGFLLPGFLMGLLQFGWLAVNIFGSTMALNAMFGFPDKSPALYAVMAIWGIAAVVAALAGIKYVAKFSTYLPLIPAAILIVLVAKTMGGLGSFDPQALVAADAAAKASGGAAAATGGMSAFGVFAFVLAYIVGFFATAGAAGVDFGTGARHKGDVALGGLVGVALAIFLTIGAAILITAGYYGGEEGKAALAAGKVDLNPMSLMAGIFKSDATAKWLAFALAITAFPSACFSSLIAANSIKTPCPRSTPGFPAASAAPSPSPSRSRAWPASAPRSSASSAPRSARSAVRSPWSTSCARAAGAGRARPSTRPAGSRGPSASPSACSRTSPPSAASRSRPPRSWPTSPARSSTPCSRRRKARSCATRRPTSKAPTEAPPIHPPERRAAGPRHAFLVSPDPPQPCRNRTASSSSS